jgi:hypothetical protein
LEPSRSAVAQTKWKKFFGSFFSKKNRFLASPRQHAFISIQDPFDLIV